MSSTFCSSSLAHQIHLRLILSQFGGSAPLFRLFFCSKTTTGPLVKNKASVVKTSIYSFINIKSWHYYSNSVFMEVEVVQELLSLFIQVKESLLLIVEKKIKTYWKPVLLPAGVDSKSGKQKNRFSQMLLYSQRWLMWADLKCV